ncbi:MAG: PEP-CTERM sorting domain-containing protein [Mariniblastus sp.]
MNNRLFVAAAVIAFGALSGLVKADVYFSEGFDYSDGSLTTVSSDWTRHSGTEGQIQVSGGKVLLTDSQSEDVNRLLGTTITTGTVFAGFDFSVSANNPGGTDFEYFAHFGNGTSDFTARMDVNTADANGFLVGISHTSTAQASWGSTLSYDTVYRAIIGYDRDSGLANLWIDASQDTDTSIVTTTNDTNNVEGFYLRESNSSVNETIVVDDLVVGSTFADVVTFNAVPEPSGLLVLGLFGFAGLARRRRS